MQSGGVSSAKKTNLGWHFGVQFVYLAQAKLFKLFASKFVGGTCMWLSIQTNFALIFFLNFFGPGSICSREPNWLSALNALIFFTEGVSLNFTHPRVTITRYTKIDSHYYKVHKDWQSLLQGTKRLTNSHKPVISAIIAQSMQPSVISSLYIGKVSFILNQDFSIISWIFI